MPPRPSGAGSLVRARATLAFRRLDQRRLLAFVVAGVVAVVTFTTVSEAQSRSASLGQTQLVAIARTDLAAGSRLTSVNIDLIERPVRFVPVRAVGSEAEGEVLIADVVAGEVIVSSRLGASGTPLGTDERAVTVPMPLAPPLLEPGDTVELVGLQAVDVAGSPAPTVATVVITTGRVLAVTDNAVTVATPDHAALEVLRYLAVGSVELVATPFQAPG